MQFKLTPNRTVLGEKVKHLLRFLHTLRTTTLFRKGRGGGEKNCVKAVFIRVSYKLKYIKRNQNNFVQKQKQWNVLFVLFVLSLCSSL